MIDTLERQKHGDPTPLTEFAEITRQKQELEARRVVPTPDLTLPTPQRSVGNFGRADGQPLKRAIRYHR
jgi:hypothetical protein